MTREELLALPLRELDAMVAVRLMEWRWIRQDLGYWHRDGLLMPKEGNVGSCWGSFLPDYLESHTVVVERPEDFPSNLPERLPRFSTDDNAARLVRNRIAELGLVSAFVSLVIQVAESSEYGGTWELINSTAREQCIAAILAVQETERGE